MGAVSAGALALKPLGLSAATAQASGDYRALVCVFLYGGNDSNNLVVPMDPARYQAYVSIRGALALQGNQLTPPVFTNTGRAPYAFHTGLKELAPLFSSGKLAVVANVGSMVQPLTAEQYQARSAAIPRNLFSHIDQQAQWQTSVSDGNSATGWAGRVADRLAALSGSNSPTFVSTAGNCILGAGEQTQPVCLNPGQSLAVPAVTASADAAQVSAMEALLNANAGAPLMNRSNKVFASLLSAGQTLNSTLAGEKPLQTTFPETGLGKQLRQIAQVIQARASLGANRQIFFCSLSGFDTHAAQLETHRSLYPQLSQALASFYSALGELGVQNDVVTFTASEFNRTFQPTSQGDGSDHGWGGHQLVLGGNVAGGEVYGSFPRFELSGPNDADNRGRWVPSTSVDQYAATLSSWLGVSGGDLQTVFPNLKNYASPTLPFLS
jgi:uncharacterized protein (DUF1501 family)